MVTDLLFLCALLNFPLLAAGFLPGSESEQQEARASEQGKSEARPEYRAGFQTPGPKSVAEEPGEGATTAPGEQSSPAASRTQRRAELNLLGQTDTRSGESRRNENIQFNLIDNNVLREMNIRLGTTATLVREFQPDYNYFGAEFGGSLPAPLHLAPSAGRGVHGNAYWTHLNSVFSARSFFQVGAVKPARENDYGFRFSVPAWRGADLSLQGSQQKIRGSVNGNVRVPRPDERTPLTTDPARRAIVESFLGAYPADPPNRTDINERALNTNAPQMVNSDTAILGLQQAIKDKDRLLLHYAFTSQRVDAFQFVAGQNPDTDTRAHNARITWTRAWSPASTSDFSAGFDRLGSLLVSEENWGGPTVAMTALTGIGPMWMIPIDRAQNRFRYAGHFRQNHGRHNWSFGSELLRQQINGWESDAHRGEIIFSDDFGRDAITNLRIGEPSLLYVSLGNVHRGFRNWLMQYFVADTWRLASNLTVNYGLQYRPATRPNEVNKLSEFLYGNDLNNVAPYLGLAYRLPGRWGGLRAGYGVHYGEIFPVTYQQVRANPPGNLEMLIPKPDLVNPLAGISEGNLVGSQYLLSPDLCTPYSQQYNFIWETQPTSFLNLQLGYVGSRSVKLLYMWEANRARPVPGIEQITETINQRRPDPSFAAFKNVINSSRGYFDAAKATVVIRSWHGLSMDASYWFSKALDLGGSYSDTAAYLDAALGLGPSEFDIFDEMKGRSRFDQPHAFLWRATYDLPFMASRAGWPARLLGGWSVFAVTLLKSGTPFTVTSGSDSPGFGNVDGTGADRMNLVDPSILGRTIGHPDVSAERLLRSAFAFMEPTEVRGNLGRNTFRRGPIRNANFSVSRKRTFPAERVLTFRAESINFFNTAQFDAPGQSLVSPDFGHITNTLNDGRTFRFLLSFSF